MGWSDIVRAPVTRPALRAAIVRVVEDLDLSDVTLAGESIGATLSLTVSVDLGDRVRRIVAFNTYDFADGVKRASFFARLVTGSIQAPVMGQSWRFEQADSRARVRRSADLVCRSTTSTNSVGVGRYRQWPGRSSATWTA